MRNLQHPQLKWPYFSWFYCGIPGFKTPYPDIRIFIPLLVMKRDIFSFSDSGTQSVSRNFFQACILPHKTFPIR